MANVIFDPERCKGCGLCVPACPRKIVRMSDKLNAKGYHPAECADVLRCVGCAFCGRMCPDSAITIYK